MYETCQEFGRFFLYVSCKKAFSIKSNWWGFDLRLCDKTMRKLRISALDLRLCDVFRENPLWASSICDCVTRPWGNCEFLSLIYVCVTAIDGKYYIFAFAAEILTHNCKSGTWNLSFYTFASHNRKLRTQSRGHQFFTYVDSKCKVYANCHKPLSKKSRFLPFCKSKCPKCRGFHLSVKASVQNAEVSTLNLQYMEIYYGKTVETSNFWTVAHHKPWKPQYFGQSLINVYCFKRPKQWNFAPQRYK
jgi:hypothetical protein